MRRDSPHQWGSFIPSAGTCPDCGKRRWLTRKDARKAMRRMHDKTLQVYQCGDYWHLGHPPGRGIPRAVMRGRQAK